MTLVALGIAGACGGDEQVDGDGGGSSSAGSSGGGNGGSSSGGSGSGGSSGGSGAQVDAGDVRHCYHPLDCNRSDCSDYVPVEPKCTPGTFVTQFFMYDGVCGAYRFRFTGNTHSGVIEYWELDTGKMVAKHTFRDFPLECQYSEYGDRTVHEQCKEEAWTLPDQLCDSDAGVDQDGGTGT